MDIGNLSFSITATDNVSKAVENIRKKLEGGNIELGVDASKLKESIDGISSGGGFSGIRIGVDREYLRKSIEDAIKKEFTMTAKVDGSGSGNGGIQKRTSGGGGGGPDTETDEEKLLRRLRRLSDRIGTLKNNADYEKLKSVYKEMAIDNDAADGIRARLTQLKAALDEAFDTGEVRAMSAAIGDVSAELERYRTMLRNAAYARSGADAKAAREAARPVAEKAQELDLEKVEYARRKVLEDIASVRGALQGGVLGTDEVRRELLMLDEFEERLRGISTGAADLRNASKEIGIVRERLGDVKKGLRVPEADGDGGSQADADRYLRMLQEAEVHLGRIGDLRAEIGGFGGLLPEGKAEELLSDLGRIEQSVRAVRDGEKGYTDGKSAIGLASEGIRRLREEVARLRDGYIGVRTVSERAAASRQRDADGIADESTRMMRLNEQLERYADLSERMDRAGGYFASGRKEAAAGRLQAARARLDGLQQKGSAPSVKELGEVGEALSLAEKDIRKAERAYADAAREAGRLAKAALGAAKETEEGAGAVKDGAEDVYRTLAGVFSVSMGRAFLGNVVRIGGELERQRIAVSAIFADVSKGAYMYGRLSELAVRSPFSVDELMAQTKQLAAFGIEYADLFDTMKRLGDIASGIGVDVQRVAYAYGQVRSRTWLDAKELRQFAYAGVPLLHELTAYYKATGKGGANVTASDVRDMVTAQKVSFEDVREVLRRMTDEGGMFFNMQEKMADSLSAKWKNLSDAISLMYGRMADGGIGKLLGFAADALSAVTRHASAASVAMLALISQFSLLSLRGSRLSKALTAMFGSRGGLTALGVSAVASIAAYAYDEYRKAADMAGEMAERGKGAAEGINRALEDIGDVDFRSIGEDAAGELFGQMVMTLRNETPEWRRMLAEAFDMDDEGRSVMSLTEKMEALRIKMREVSETGSMMASMGSEMEAVLRATDGMLFGAFDDNVVENIADWVKEFEGADAKLAEAVRSSGGDSAIAGVISKIADATEGVDYGKLDDMESYLEKIRYLESSGSNFGIDYSKGIGQPSYSELWKTFNLLDAVQSWRRTGSYKSDGYKEMISDMEDAKDSLSGILRQKGLFDYDKNEWKEDAVRMIQSMVDAFVDKAGDMKDDTRDKVRGAFLGLFGLDYKALTEGQAAEAERLAEGFAKAVSDEGEAGGKDAVADEWESRLRLIREYMQEYGKWKELAGEEKAVEKISGSAYFSGLTGSRLWNGRTGQFDMRDPEGEYGKFMDYVGVNARTDRQKEVWKSVTRDMLTMDKDAADMAARESVERLRVSLSELQDRWSVYDEVLGKTGDKGLAARISEWVGDGSVTDELRRMIEEESNKIGKSFGDVTGMTESDFAGSGIGRQSYQGILMLTEKWREENAKMRKDTLDTYMQMLEASDNYARRREKIELDYRRKLAALKAIGGDDVQEREAQLGKWMRGETDKVNWEEIKEGIGFTELYGELERLGDGTIEKMMRALGDARLDARIEDPKVLKEVTEAVEKLRREWIGRNPFRTLGEAADNFRKHTEWLREAEANGGTARVTVDGVPQEYTAERIEDMLRGDTDDYVKGVGMLSEKFGKLGDVLQPVIAMFDKLGIGGVGGAFSLLQGGLSAAAGVSGGLQALGAGAGLAKAGGWIGAGLTVVTGLADALLGGGKSGYEMLAEKFETLRGTLDELISVERQALSEASGQEAVTAAGRSMSALELELARMQELAWKYNWRGNGWVGRYGGAIEAGYGVRTKYGDGTLNASELVWADGDTLRRIMEDMPEAWSELNDTLREYLEGLIGIYDQMDEVREELSSKLTGLDAQGIMDGWSSLMDGMDASASDLADSIEGKLRGAILDSMLSNLYKDRIQELIDMATGLARNDERVLDENGNVLSEYTREELEMIRANTGVLAAMVEQSQDALSEILGETGTSQTVSAITQGVTEDTATVISGYMGAIHASQLLAAERMRVVSDEMLPRMSVLMDAQVGQMRQVAENTLRIAQSAERVETLLGAVANGSKSLKVR